jgi:hypothetical protein
MYNINIEGFRIEHLGTDYVCDFDVHYELVNPKDDIYTPEGEEAFDRGQDEVNFTQVEIKIAMSLGRDGMQITNSATLASLNEICLDWCRDEPSMHIEAFKQAKSQKPLDE